MANPHERLLLAIGMTPKKPDAAGAPPSVRDQLMGSSGSAPAPEADHAANLAQGAGDYAESEFKCPACGAQLCAKQSEATDTGEPESGMVP